MSARRKGKARSVMVAPKGGGEPAIAIPGVAVEKEAKKGSSGFKKGGAAMADGNCAPSRMDKAPRKASGGGITMRGRSPFSSAARIDGGTSKATKADH